MNWFRGLSKPMPSMKRNLNLRKSLVKERGLEMIGLEIKIVTQGERAGIKNGNNF